MIYIVYEVWSNTAKNHAGFAYLCEAIQKRYPSEFKVLNFRTAITPFKGKSKLESFFNWFIYRYNHHGGRLWCKIRCAIFSKTLSNKDVLLFTEHIIRDANYHEMMFEFLRKSKARNFAFAHLTPRDLDWMFTDEEIAEKLHDVDGLFTLGSSLPKYFETRGVPADKMYTTFHYVDDYYLHKPEVEKRKFKVLAQGNMARDLDTLDVIVNSCPDIEFIICQGVRDFSSRYNQPNVTLKSFMPEEELRQLMKDCPVSLNCMLDTIGSNVICTSLGMGMAMVCSDVGSIRDYCDDANSFLCKTPEDFVVALNKLKEDPDLLRSMQQDSFNKAQKYTIPKFVEDVKSFINSKK